MAQEYMKEYMKKFYHPMELTEEQQEDVKNTFHYNLWLIFRTLEDVILAALDEIKSFLNIRR